MFKSRRSNAPRPTATEVLADAAPVPPKTLVAWMLCGGGPFTGLVHQTLQ